MKKVLVLGAGLVTRPLVRYLLDVPDIQLTMATRTVSKAEKMLEGHERGKALALDIKDEEAVGKLVSENDIAISLVPYTYHLIVAKQCLKHKKHMVTTSYVSDDMRALDKDAKAAGLLFINEVGVDPGIDHMSAMRIIDSVKNGGGKVTSFMSYCGGLPAPEANTNPFGYKLSWSPQGVILAGRNNGHYMKDGKEIFVPGKDLFSHTWKVEVEGLPILDAYVNRDAYPYIELYGLKGIETMYRGTLRYEGWCETWLKLSQLGVSDLEERDLGGMTACDFMAGLAGIESSDSMRADLASHLGIDASSAIMDRIEWLGLLDNKLLGFEKASPVAVMEKLMNERMQYAEGERDMLVMRHEFRAELPDGKKEITSTLIDFGIPGGDSSMSRTVSLPAAICTKLMLEGGINAAGVHIPVIPEIYNPVLDELEKVGIKFEETEKNPD
ncbi:MAG: saccharopine dehydrogenase C-terminal domain-containing protein [Planctomycetota bacterium]|jgi:saccharopine dehydrogenase-like NADP-dependent oxidoreductase